MKKNQTVKMPTTRSVQNLADFWDTHDLTDFEDQLQEVTAPVFVADDSIHLHLKARDADAVREIAKSKGISQADLIQQWISQKLGDIKKHA